MQRRSAYPGKDMPGSGENTLIDRHQVHQRSCSAAVCTATRKAGSLRFVLTTIPMPAPWLCKNHLHRQRATPLRTCGLQHKAATARK